MNSKVSVKMIVSSLLALIVLSVFPLNAFASGPGVTDPQVQQELASVRQATFPYQDVANAVADGFVPTMGCVMNEDGTAAMGIHYINFARAMDPAINMLEPEALLYAPTEDGLRLVGVEYFLAVGPTDFIPPDVLPAPVLFGQTFDGPMFGHEPGMPSHYDLHVWLWQANPLHVCPFKPNVSCQLISMAFHPPPVDGGFCFNVLTGFQG